MSLFAAIGNAHGLDGREAGLQAARQALSQMGRNPVAFGLVVSSNTYPMQHVLAGVVSLLGDTPLLGFSSTGELTADGWQRRTVTVALLGGESIHARADWWSNFVEDSRSSVQKMFQTLLPAGPDGAVLIAVCDGFSGDVTQLDRTTGGLPMVGGLAGGDLQRGRTFQIGGRQSGSRGLSAAVLSGKLVVGVGTAHGWQPVGAYSRLTQVDGLLVRQLDEKQASETYARLFGRPVQEWVYPPLNEMVRLYPLGMEQGNQMIIRSPLRIETDGSLRMNVTMPEGEITHIMVGDPDLCLEAARSAARQAMARLKGARPVLGWILVDAAWQALMEANVATESDALRQELGNVPLIGGYTFGQLSNVNDDDNAGALQILNQHIEVVLFGDPG